MIVSGAIDWFAGTCDVMAFPANFPLHTILATPQRGYTSAVQFVPDGRRVSSNRQRDDMPDHVTYSGATLAWLSVVMSAQRIVRWHMTNTGIESDTNEYWASRNREPRPFRCTRIDVAVDVRGGNLSVDRLYKHFQAGRVVTRATGASIVKNTSGGKTLYVGSRTSEMFLRVYDKAKEQKQDGDWKRIELEVKGGRANALAKQLALSDSPMRVITGTIAGYCMFKDYPTYVRALGDKNDAQIIPGQKVVRNTRKWLLSQVVSAIVTLYNEGDEEIVADVLSAVRDRINKQ